MSTRPVALAEHEFYHVYNRGTEKRTIYQSAQDYQRFIELLFLANSEKSFNVRNIRREHEDLFNIDRGSALVAVGAYCLMPNHFHLLIKPQKEGGLSKFMNKLTTGYSMYFNKKYERTGSLFEGSFKAKHASTDEYLKYLFSYIHLNPVKLYQSNWREEGVNQDEALAYLKNYHYSSFLDYCGSERKASTILAKEHFPDYFTGAQTMEGELFSWLAYETDLA